MRLALVRHGQSEWNALGLWTGWQDINLSPIGKKEAKSAAFFLKDIKFHFSYSSDLKRAKDTLKIIREELNLEFIPQSNHHALKERNYGEFTGINKWDIEKKVGKEKFRKIRRGWQEKIKKGETLKDVYNRVIPYYKTEIFPKIGLGKNILLVAHGNTIRALIKYLENISDTEIEKIELETGEIVIYHLNKEGKVIKKEKRRNISEKA